MLGNPLPGTNWNQCGGYDADSGLDILVPSGTPVYTPADGIIEYAEEGHTPWVEDTDYGKPGFQPPHSIRIRLAVPVTLNGKIYPFLWYTHLSSVEPRFLNKYDVPVKAGSLLGRTGIGNKVPHLHFGILVDRAQTITMHWRDVAEQIWGPKNGGHPSSPKPSHPPGVKKVKIFANPNGRKIVVNEETHAIKSLKVNGAEIQTTEIIVEY